MAKSSVKGVRVEGEVRRTTDEDCRCGRKFLTLYIFYWIKVFLKLPFAVSFSVLYIYTYILEYLYQRPDNRFFRAESVIVNIIHVKPFCKNSPQLKHMNNMKHINNQ